MKYLAQFLLVAVLVAWLFLWFLPKYETPCFPSSDCVTIEEVK